ncbi:MAG: DEAD/DEAH box helicase [Planctomycetota bacterium]
MPTFADLGLCEPLCRALEPDAFAAPTAVQVRVVPLLLQGRDLLALAPAGSGKSVAWALGLLQRLADPAITAEPRHPRALVLTKDRESCEAIGLELETVGRYLPVRHIVAAEGAGWNHQMQELRTGVELIVATPKRLLELQRERAVALRAIELVVVDDADVLIDLDLVLELERIRVALPDKRQTVMLAASTPAALRPFAEEWMHRPVGVNARGPAPRKTPHDPGFAIPKISDDVTADPPAIELPDWLDEAPPVFLPGWLDDDSAVFDAPTHAAAPDDEGDPEETDDAADATPLDAATDTDGADYADETDDDAGETDDDDLDALVAEALDELDRRARSGTDVEPPPPPGPTTAAATSARAPRKAKGKAKATPRTAKKTKATARPATGTARKATPKTAAAQKPAAQKPAAKKASGRKKRS